MNPKKVAEYLSVYPNTVEANIIIHAMNSPHKEYINYIKKVYKESLKKVAELLECTDYPDCIYNEIILNKKKIIHEFNNLFNQSR